MGFSPPPLHDIKNAPVVVIVTEALQQAALIDQERNSKLQEEGGAASVSVRPLVVCSETVARLPAMVTRQTENMWQLLEGTGKGKSVFRWMLRQLEDLMFQLNLTQDWAHRNHPAASSSTSSSPSKGDSMSVDGTPSPNGDTSGFVFDLENPSGFFRLWSALSFLFCVVETNDPAPGTTPAGGADKGGGSAGSSRRGSNDGSVTSNPAGGAGGARSSEASLDNPTNKSGGAEDEEVLVSNDAEFGHGFTIAGCLFLHFMNQRPVFELMDFSTQVLKIHDHDSLPVGMHDGSSAGGGEDGEGGGKNGGSTASDNTTGGGAERYYKGVDASLVRDTRNFIEAALLQKNLQKQIFSLFEALHTPTMATTQKNTTSSGGKLGTAPATMTIFHPPKETSSNGTS